MVEAVLPKVVPESAQGTEGTPTMDLAQGLRGAPWSWLSTVLPKVPQECPRDGGDADHGTAPEPTGSFMVVAVHRPAQIALEYPQG